MSLPDETRRETLVGRCLESDRLEVSAELSTRFARAINDEDPRYLGDDPRATIAPPMFGIVPAMRLFRRANADGSLPLQEERTVHGEQDMRFLSPIRPGDVLLTRAEVVGSTERGTGSTIDIECRTSTEEGEERLRQLITLFVRDAERRPNQRSQRRPPGHGEPDYLDFMRVDSDQTYRYARASFTQGIRPHEDPAFARSLGYRTMFLQGQCTMAFAAKALVDTTADGDPTRLLRLRVRFAAAVYPDDLVTTRIWTTEHSGQYVLDAVNQEGVTVLASGLAEIRR